MKLCKWDLCKCKSKILAEDVRVEVKYSSTSALSVEVIKLLRNQSLSMSTLRKEWSLETRSHSKDKVNKSLEWNRATSSLSYNKSNTKPSNASTTTYMLT